MGRVVDQDGLAAAGQRDMQRKAITGKALRDQPRAGRQRNAARRGVGRHVRRDGRRRGRDGHRFVDKRGHHRHKGEEQDAEIDRHEAHQLAAHALRGRVERLFLVIVRQSARHVVRSRLK